MDFYFVASLGDQDNQKRYNKFGDELVQSIDPNVSRDRSLLEDYHRAKVLYAARFEVESLADWAVDRVIETNGIVIPAVLWALEQIQSSDRAIARKTVFRIRTIAVDLAQSNSTSEFREYAITIRLARLRDWGVKNGHLLEDDWPDVGQLSQIDQ